MAKANRLDPDLLQGLIWQESRFNPRARSSSGALGLTQLMPDDGAGGGGLTQAPGDG